MAGYLQKSHAVVSGWYRHQQRLLLCAHGFCLAHERPRLRVRDSRADAGSARVLEAPHKIFQVCPFCVFLPLVDTPPFCLNTTHGPEI